MYKRHVLMAVVIFVGAFFLSSEVHANYFKLCNNAMTVVSIAIAVYIAVPSFMTGSSYASKLKQTADPPKIGISQLGTLKTYLMDSMFFSILTIVISGIYSLELKGIGKILNNKVDVDQLISSFSCALFVLNIFFLWLVFKMTLVTMMNAAISDNQDEKD